MPKIIYKKEERTFFLTQNKIHTPRSIKINKFKGRSFFKKKGRHDSRYPSEDTDEGYI